MQVTFVSGWSGLPCLYPRIASKADFIVPFFSHTKDEVVSTLHNGGDLLIAWSTGAHLVLDQLSLIGDKYSYIILIAPFIDFTSSVPVRVIKRMRSRLFREPQTTVSDFWKLCGGTQQCPSLSDQQIEFLAAGLDLLMNSQIRQPLTGGHNVTLVQCLNDQVVLPAAFNAVSAALKQATVFNSPSPHMLPEHELIRIVSDVCGTTLL